MKRLLVQTQLSNYDNHGKFILECDSGWQMVMGRVREMLRINPDLCIDVMGPNMEEGHEQCITHPVDVNPDLWDRHGHDGDNRLRYIGHRIIPNALVTRYDFDWTGLAVGLDLGMQKIGRAPKYDAVYINDPMHLRAFKAMFHVVAGYQPRFYVHSHFVDVPSCPKFPEEASLWHGQLEAAMKADYNFWQCAAALKEFEREADNVLKWNVVNEILEKSSPWDDGYSRAEITVPVDESNMRFTPEQWDEKTRGKVILFFPNRISPSSNDYTNGMKFMFEVLPAMWKDRPEDFIVICGNPNQKFSNEELTRRCGHHGYVSMAPDTFNRDEFKFVASHSHVALGLYDQDAYGGTAARECIELGCMPLWLDVNEYSSIAREAAGYPFVARGMDGVIGTAYRLMETLNGDPHGIVHLKQQLQKVVRDRCSYEATTPRAMKQMGLYP